MKSSISLHVLLCLFVLLAVLAIPSMPAQAQTLKVLYSFGEWPDGTAPGAGLVRDKLGNLYGTCQEGGDTGWGTVFKVDTSGNETVLHSFNQPLANGTTDGATPLARLIMDKRGNLYGTTEQAGNTGGESGDGTVFKLDSAGNLTALHIFTGPDGAAPVSALLMDKRGNLYGTTVIGGSSNEGTVFKLDPAGHETVLHSFAGPDGEYPTRSDLIMDNKENLYGTTSAGGDFGAGTVFKLDTAGKESVLHSFAGPDGAAPSAGVIRDNKGNLYGSTSAGGDFDAGAVFRLDTAGKETVLHSFTGSPEDGALPTGDLAMDKAGNLYGTTVDGGSFGIGIVFKLDTAGNETVLHNFADTPDGTSPFGGVIMDKKGNLYGTTQNGGDVGHGTVFELVP